MSLEDTLSGWTGPSSDTEQDKQDRTIRMIREAVQSHDAFDDCTLSVYPKGSYANNTNVRADSDVDVAIQCHDCTYWEEQSPGAHPASNPYKGPWTPQKLRSELVEALRAKFPGHVDTSGSTAIGVNSSSARVDADVVPCFGYTYYFDSGHVRKGVKIFPSGPGSRPQRRPSRTLQDMVALFSRSSSTSPTMLARGTSTERMVWSMRSAIPRSRWAALSLEEPEVRWWDAGWGVPSGVSSVERPERFWAGLPLTSSTRVSCLPLRSGSR